ncbi:DUF4231 domain-containing protein [Polymorphospora rubra]|uniref:SMODS and SLOG-associating 2TM effector domain-containing protein n=1 Tax=Polymorphospora rubra TaxID=338584 RepID=A0A810MUW1_9ACTN|nr:DUF4231 domain-containing protein [Polymorphospora rubra]BCJ64967.1 hypothetical protein Prubr_19880 [Polymorphospora rubra]
MAATTSVEVLAVRWRRQSVWSQGANQLKAQIRRARLWAMLLTVGGALFSAVSVQLISWLPTGAKVFAGLAAVSLGLVPVLGRGAGSTVVRDWTRARSVSEAIKTEIYTYLAGVTPYRGEDRTTVLVDRLDALMIGADDLEQHVAGIAPVPRPLPDVHDVDSYVRIRVQAQIDGYYRFRAAGLRHRVNLLRRIELGLAMLGAVLAAIAGFVPAAGLTAWVGLITTISTAVVAHAAAERYEYQQIEFSRTADGLEDLLARYVDGPGGAAADDALVAGCERVISIQNEGWMAKLNSEEPAA